MELVTIAAGEKWYHSSYGFKGLQADRLIFLSKKPNYSRYVIKWLNDIFKKMIDGCCSYDLSSPVYELTTTKSLVLGKVVNETFLNYFTEKHDINLYCNIKDIDGLYTPRGFNFQEVICVYVRDPTTFAIREMTDYKEGVSSVLKTLSSLDMIYQLLEVLLFAIPAYKAYSDIKTITGEFNNDRSLQMKKSFFDKNPTVLSDIYFLSKINETKVMSYNVHGFTDTLNRCTKRQIIDMIKSISPDVCCLQEAMPLNAKDLPGYTVIKAFNNVVAIKGEHRVLCSSSHRLPGSFDTYRWLQYVSVNINGYVFNIFHTHLDPWDLTGKKKYEQFKFVLKTMEKKACTNSILLGDFNDINLQDYSESQQRFMRKYENRFISKYNFNTLIPENMIDTFKGNSYSCWTNKRVDYIISDIDVYKKYLNKYIVQTNYSDHLPLIMVLQK